MRSKLLFAALVVVCATLLGFSACTSRDKNPGGEKTATQTQPWLAEPPSMAPTTGWWWTDIPVSQINQNLQTFNARLTSVQVTQVNPLLLTVTAVANSGPYQKPFGNMGRQGTTGGWWFTGITKATLDLYAEVLNARVTNMDAYVVNGTTEVAAILIPNVGSDALETHTWVDISGPDLSSAVFNQAWGGCPSNCLRLVDWRQYTKNGVTTNAAVAVANYGPMQPGWAYFPGLNVSTINAKLQAGNYFLSSVQPADPNGNTFNVIMTQNQQAPAPSLNWITWYGQSAVGLGLLTLPGSSTSPWRVVDLKSWGPTNNRLYVAIAAQNTAFTGGAATEATCDTSTFNGWVSGYTRFGQGSVATETFYDA